VTALAVCVFALQLRTTFAWYTRDRWAGAERYFEFVTTSSLAACGEESPVALATWNTRTGQFSLNGTRGALQLAECANETYAAPVCNAEALSQALEQLSFALGNASEADAVAAVNTEAWLNCSAHLHRHFGFSAHNVTDTACLSNQTCCAPHNRTMWNVIARADLDDACVDGLTHVIDNAMLDYGCYVQEEPFNRPSINISLCDFHARGRVSCKSNADCFTRCVSGRCEAPVGTGDALWVRCVLRQARADILAVLSDRWGLDPADEVGWLEQLTLRTPMEVCTNPFIGNATVCESNVTCNAPPCDNSTFCGECEGSLCRSAEVPSSCLFPGLSGSACTERGGTDTSSGCLLSPATEAECFSDCSAVLPCTNDCSRGQPISVDLPHRTVEWCEGGPGCALNASLFNVNLSPERHGLLSLSCARDVCVDPWRTSANCSRHARVVAPSAVLTGSFGVGVTLLSVQEVWNWTGGELVLWLTWTTSIPDLQLQQSMTANLTFNGVTQTPRLSVSVETCTINCVYEFVFRWPGLCSERQTLLSYNWRAGGRFGTRTGTLRVAECLEQTVWRNGRCEKTDTAACGLGDGFSLIPGRVFQPALRKGSNDCRSCGLEVANCTGLVGCDRTCGACRGSLLRCVHTNATRCASLGSWDGSQCVVLIARAGDCNDTLQTCAGHTQSSCPSGCNWTDVPCATEAQCLAQGECSDWELSDACIVPGPCPGLGCISLLAPCPVELTHRARNESECLSRKACYGAEAHTETECLLCGGTWRSVYQWIPGVWGAVRSRALTRQPRALVPNARWLTVIDRGAAANLFQLESERLARRNAGLRCALAPRARALSLYASSCLGAPSRAPEPVIDELLVCGDRMRLQSGPFEVRATCVGAPVRVRLSNDAASHDLPGRRLLAVDAACSADVTNAMGEVIGQRVGDCMELVLSDPIAEMRLCLALPLSVAQDTTRFNVSAMAFEGVAIALANASDTQLCANVPGVSGRYCPAAVWSTNLSAAPRFAALVCNETASQAMFGCDYTLHSDTEVWWMSYLLRLPAVCLIIVSLSMFVFSVRTKQSYVRAPSSLRQQRFAKPVAISPIPRAAMRMALVGALAAVTLAFAAGFTNGHTTHMHLFATGLPLLSSLFFVVSVLSLNTSSQPLALLAAWACLLAGLLLEASERKTDALVVSVFVQLGVSTLAIFLLIGNVCRPHKIRVLCVMFVAAALAIWLVVMRRVPCA